jgi:hypothetical protein
MFIKQAIEDKENEKKIQSNREFNLSIDLLREKLLHNEFLKNKTLSFASKFLAGFDQKSVEEVKESISREKPNLSLRQVLERVNNFVDCMKEDGEELKLK